MTTGHLNCLLSSCSYLSAEHDTAIVPRSVYEPPTNVVLGLLSSPPLKGITHVRVCVFVRVCTPVSPSFIKHTWS